MHCEINEEGVEVTNALGRSFLKWQIFRKVVRSPEVWLFFVNRQQYFSLPAEKLAGPPAAFVDDDIRAIGGKLL